MNEFQILATGRNIIGEGIRGTEPVIEEMMTNATNEIHMLAYVISGHSEKILELLESRLEKGISIKLVINSIQNQDAPVREKLLSLNREFKNFQMGNFIDPNGGELHAKVLVRDRKEAVIGSANFSWHGLTKNHEVGVHVIGEHVWKLASIVDDLCEKFLVKKPSQ